ncbi:MAG: two-component sensor histidine kinase [Desulfobulbaceae bacterium]|nr:two-component sensor histidine kinase [Desulfobulbaceae bacterium]
MNRRRSDFSVSKSLSRSARRIRSQVANLRPSDFFKAPKNLVQALRKMKGREQDGGLLPFALVKYFAFTSLGLILFASIVLSWVLSNNAKNVLLERSEAYSQLFAENLNRQVFLQFVLPTVVRYGRIALSNENQFARLDRIVRNITRGMHIDSVTIFDSQENIIAYSTVAELVGKRNMGGIEYKKAVAGDDNSVLISSGSLLNLFPGSPEVFCTLQTYVPFRQEGRLGERSGEIMGVVEVVQDLSDDLKAIIELQARIIVLSLTVLGLLFAVLSIIVVKANRIMAARAMERLRLEEKLNESERLASLGKMVASVSHEIKNPLGIVRSTAEILRKRISKVAPENEHLAGIIMEETSRLDGIVREFLDFARPRDPRMEKGSVNLIVERIGRFMEPELKNKSIVLEQNLDPSLPDVLMDSEQIYQVIFNIMFNAVQAMPDGGTVVVRTINPSGSARVTVEISDTGPGMSKEKLEQIFTPFYTDKNRGSGLGLAIARNIMEKHNGAIEVESRAGQGSTFRVILGIEG